MTPHRIATALIAPTLVFRRCAWGAAITVTRSFDGVRDNVRRDLTIAGRVPCTATPKPTKPPGRAKGLSRQPRAGVTGCLAWTSSSCATPRPPGARPAERITTAWARRATKILSPFTSRPIGQAVHAAGVRGDRRGRREG